MRAKSGTILVRPELPIYDSVELRELVTHLICDGYASLQKFASPKYVQINRSAVEEFQNRLGVFGPQETNIVLEQKVFPRKDSYKLGFSKTIPQILSHYFQISFMGDEARLPALFYSGKREFLVAIVRAFLIDEGSINDRTLQFCSGSKMLLEDLQKICVLLGYESYPVRLQGRAYYLLLSPHSFERVYGDIMALGTLSIQDKQEKFDLGMRIVNNKEKIKDLPDRILNLLRQSPLSTLSLAKALSLNRKRISYILLTLKRKGIVLREPITHNGKSRTYLWRLS